MAPKQEVSPFNTWELCTKQKQLSLPKKKCTQPPPCVLPEEEYASHMVELVQEWRKPAINRSEAHLRSLLRETFSNRQQWIKGQPDCKIGPILQAIPCYEDATFVSKTKLMSPFTLSYTYLSVHI